MPLRSWYNCGTNHFHQADFCLAEMKKPTVLRNKCSPAWSCAEDQIFVGFLRKKSSEKDFEYLYWTISKIICWNLFTWKGIYMIDWVGRIWPSPGGTYPRPGLSLRCVALFYWPEGEEDWEARPPVALGSSPELSAFTMSLAPPVGRGGFISSNLTQVSSIGRLLFNRLVDRSRSISTVNKDSPTWEYGQYCSW